MAAEARAAPGGAGSRRAAHPVLGEEVQGDSSGWSQLLSQRRCHVPGPWRSSASVAEAPAERLGLFGEGLSFPLDLWRGLRPHFVLGGRPHPALPGHVRRRAPQATLKALFPCQAETLPQKLPLLLDRMRRALRGDLQPSRGRDRKSGTGWTPRVALFVQRR